MCVDYMKYYAIFYKDLSILGFCYLVGGRVWGELS